MDTFKIEIKIGNAGMQTPGDVAVALRAVARAITGMDWDEVSDAPSRIFDENGNTVGFYGLADGSARR
jgi:hypothetical protein